MPYRRLRIGAARRADLPQLVALSAAADDAERGFSPDLTVRRSDRRQARRWFAGALRDRWQRVLVARGSAGPVGMMGVEIRRARHRHAMPRRYAFLHSLFVLPAYRRLGIARRLVAAGLRYAQRRGAGQARLEMAAANAAARRVYLTAGFRVREMMFTRDLRGPA